MSHREKQARNTESALITIITTACRRDALELMSCLSMCMRLHRQLTCMYYIHTYSYALRKMRPIRTYTQSRSKLSCLNWCIYCNATINNTFFTRNVKLQRFDQWTIIKFHIAFSSRWIWEFVNLITSNFDELNRFQIDFFMIVRNIFLLCYQNLIGHLFKICSIEFVSAVKIDFNRALYSNNNRCNHSK